MTTDFQHQVFSLREAAAHLKISRAFIYKLIAEKKIKPFKIGTRTLFTGIELERFTAQAVQE